VVFTQGTANLIERLARLPTVPQLGFLLRRKPSSLPLININTTFAKSF
jgi:hypothetical protein